jgi:hypothetical protein
MREYFVYVDEIRLYSVQYSVEAKNEKEARKKASLGDTVYEDDISLKEILHRHVKDVEQGEEE